MSKKQKKAINKYSKVINSMMIEGLLENLD